MKAIHEGTYLIDTDKAKKLGDFKYTTSDYGWLSCVNVNADVYISEWGNYFFLLTVLKDTDNKNHSDYYPKVGSQHIKIMDKKKLIDFIYQINPELVLKLFEDKLEQF